MSNPVEDFVKTAGPFFEGLKRAFGGEAVGAMLGGAAISAGMAAGAVGARGAYRAIKGHFTKQRDYRDMLQANPMLRKEDSGRVQMLYNSFRKMAPDMAGDPLLAGSFVRQHIELSPEAGPAISPQTMATVTKAQESLSRGKPKALGAIGEAFAGADIPRPPTFGYKPERSGISFSGARGPAEARKIRKAL